MFWTAYSPFGMVASVGDVRLPGWKADQLQRALQSLLKYIGGQAAASNSLLQDDEVSVHQTLIGSRRR
jgi:hypothetical protein